MLLFWTLFDEQGRVKSSLLTGRDNEPVTLGPKERGI